MGTIKSWVLLFYPVKFSHALFFSSKNTPTPDCIIRTPSGKWFPDKFVDFGTYTSLMNVDANVQWMDLDSIIRTFFILSGLCNPKCVNHPVESQQNRVRNDVSGLHNPESIKNVWIMESELHQHRGRNHMFWLGLCFRATTLNCLWFRPVFQTEKSIYKITLIKQHNIIIQMLHNIIIQNIQT